MRTWGFRILLSFVSLATLAAEDAPRLGVDLESGLVWGNARELVFDPTQGRNEGDPVSLLGWPVPPSYQLGLTAQLDWWSFSTQVSVRGAWPLVTGTMTDEDWRTTTYDGFLNYGRSQSEAFVSDHWSVIVQQGVRWGELTLGVGGLAKSTSWEAWGGNTRYEYALTPVKESKLSGLVLEYRQRWYIPYLTAQWEAAFQGWTVTPSARVAPYTWCFDTDNHMLATKRVTYLDNLRGGWYVQAGLEVTFPRVFGLTGGVRGTWEAAWGVVGDTYAIAPNLTTQPTVTVGGAGGGFQEAALALFVRN